MPAKYLISPDFKTLGLKLTATLVPRCVPLLPARRCSLMLEVGCRLCSSLKMKYFTQPHLIPYWSEWKFLWPILSEKRTTDHIKHTVTHRSFCPPPVKQSILLINSQTELFTPTLLIINHYQRQTPRRKIGLSSCTGLIPATFYPWCLQLINEKRAKSLHKGYKCSFGLQIRPHRFPHSVFLL